MCSIGTLTMHGPNITMCSTPFGDIDGCTFITSVMVIRCKLSAQRLSATLMDARALQATPSTHAGIMCSTPFGDIDGCTRCGSCKQTNCAQRLSATLMDALLSEPVPSCAPRRAQRLSATLMDAQKPRCNADCKPLASHLCSTPFGDIDGCTPRPAKSGDAWSSYSPFQACG